MAPSVALIRFRALGTALKTLAKHCTSRKHPREWDLRFHIQFAILRNLLASAGRWTIEEFQALAGRALPPLKGMWAINVTITPGTKDALLIESEIGKTIELLGPGLDGLEILIEPVMAEWQGAQKVLYDKRHWRLSPEAEYKLLVDDTKDGPVILYFHGGAYIVGAPDTTRLVTLKLAEECKGRVFSVGYRLAPQHQFPAALIDAMVAYQYLIKPPPDALHQAVDPSKIILAGDSAGGGLAMSLMMVLAHSFPTFPLPAAVIGLSPWLDITHSFPSARVDRGLDYLPNPWAGLVEPKPSMTWPPSKPRYHFYTDIPLHPLVSPVVMAGELPEFPPVFIAIGENEYLRDENIYFAAQFARNGGTIRLQTYVAMCHVFQMFPQHPCTLASFYELRKFIYEATSGAQIESEMRIVDGDGRIQEDPLDLDKYPITITKEELLKRMGAEVSRRYASMNLACK